MTDLYPIPWQPWYKLTRRTLDLLGAASELAGHEIEVVDAWRAYKAQKGFWDARVAYLNGTGPYAPPASNPDDPNAQRNHQRAAAVDLKYPARDGRFLAAVGMTVDPVEDWHYNDPNWRNMPIILTDTSTASGGAIPITPTKEADMPLNQADVDLLAKTFATKEDVRREERFRLYYCPNPPANLPYFVAIDRDGEPGRNILYANDLGTDQGAHQATQWRDKYYMVGDTAAQAKANPIDRDTFAKLVAFAEGTDSAFKNARAK